MEKEQVKKARKLDNSMKALIAALTCTIFIIMASYLLYTDEIKINEIAPDDLREETTNVNIG